MKRAAVLLAPLAALAVPALAWAAEAEEAGGGHEALWEWANLLLLVGVLVFFARKPVSSYLADRRSGIQRDIEGAEQLLREAEARLREWNARAARLESDVAEIQRVAVEAAEQQAAQIVADARATAERIRREAAAAVEREGARARARLRQEAADLAVQSAERLLRSQIQPSDGDRLFEEFVATLERPAPAGRS